VTPALTTGFSRRRFLQAGAAAGAVLLAPRTGVAFASTTPPRTGFEVRNGASWTTHAEELEFLEAVAAASPRVHITQIGTTVRDRPLHLVTLSVGAPRDPIAAQSAPITLFVGSQHGNEPAGRECSLQLIRDLAFTEDPVLLRQLREQTVLVIPSANPDGRAANTRGNANGVDINRDHMTLVTPEARAIAGVILSHNPDLVLDLHEYGPSVPVLYDADILYLWPRNLNADAAVRDLSRTLAEQYIRKGAEAKGYTADEYGLYKVGPNEVTQTAGDEDEGICRNAMGLRHALGILVESAVSAHPKNGVEEVTTTATLQRRRVASQVQVAHDTLRFMRDQGEVAKFASDGAPIRKAREGAEASTPVYFYGADNSAPTPSQIQDPPPIAYRLTAAQAEQHALTLSLHGIRTEADADGVLVPMGQAARPVIPLLLDSRARRTLVAGQPIYRS
jgi:hypothetical protein